MKAYVKVGTNLLLILSLSAYTGAEDPLPPLSRPAPVQNTSSTGAQPAPVAATNSTSSGSGTVPTSGPTNTAPATPASANPFDGETPEMQEISSAATPVPPPCAGLLGQDLDPIACQPQLQPLTNESLKSFLCTLEPFDSRFPSDADPLFDTGRSVTRPLSEELFGPCDGTVIPGVPNLTVYVRIAPPAGRIAPTRFADITDSSLAALLHRQLLADQTLEGSAAAPGQNLIFELVVEGKHVNPITVRYTTGKTSYPKIDEILATEATPGVDYLTVSGQVTFPPNPDGGQKSRLVIPNPPNPRDPPASEFPPHAGWPGVRVPPIGDAACEEDELMGFRITHVVHTEPNEPGLPNNGAPQLIQKAALGEILNDDSCGTVLQSFRCGNDATGKKLVLSAKTSAIRGTGTLAGMIPQAMRDQGANEKTFNLVIDADGKSDADATPTAAAAREGALVPLTQGSTGSSTLYNRAFGTAAIQPVVSALAAVENLSIAPLVTIGAAVATAQLSSSYVLAGPLAGTDPATATIAFNGPASGATASIAKLSLMGMTIPLDAVNAALLPKNTELKPPQPLPLGNARIVLNEQLAAENTPATIDAQTSSVRRSVNLLHLYSDQGELVVGHSEVLMECVADAP